MLRLIGGRMGIILFHKDVKQGEGEVSFASEIQHNVGLD